MTPETREAVAMSAAGHWIGYVHGDRAEQIINDAAGGISRAVEVAMTVTVTEEIMQEALDSVYADRGAYGRYHTAIKAALKAAGFKVVP